jgi:hypothetical protein
MGATRIKTGVCPSSIKVCKTFRLKTRHKNNIKGTAALSRHGSALLILECFGVNLVSNYADCAGFTGHTGQ